MTHETMSQNNQSAHHPRPRREVQDLIRDFGRIAQHPHAVWVNLYPYQLPAYLRSLPVVQEALGWTMVVCDQGKTTLWLQRRSYQVS